MLRSDFLVHNEVRRELVRTQANLEKIQFGVTQGVVYFGGEFWVRMGLRRLDGQKYFDTLISTLIGLEKRLRRIPGIKDIRFAFNNLEKQSGFWHRSAVNTKPIGTGGPGPTINRGRLEATESLDGRHGE